MRKEADARLVRRTAYATAPRAVRRRARVRVDGHHLGRPATAPASLGRERRRQQPPFERAWRAVVGMRGGGGRGGRGDRIATKARDGAPAAAADAVIVVLDAVDVKPEPGRRGAVMGTVFQQQHVVQLLDLRPIVVHLLHLVILIPTWFALVHVVLWTIYLWLSRRLHHRVLGRAGFVRKREPSGMLILPRLSAPNDSHR